MDIDDIGKEVWVKGKFLSIDESMPKYCYEIELENGDSGWWNDGHEIKIVQPLPTLEEVAESMGVTMTSNTVTFEHSKAGKLDLPRRNYNVEDIEKYIVAFMLMRKAMNNA